MKDHKAKEFFESASKDYEGLIRKTSGDLRLVKAPAMDIIKLAKAIKDNNEKVRVLDLSFNEIGDKGILEVAFALKGNKTIQSLSFAATKIGDSGDGGFAGTGSAVARVVGETRGRPHPDPSGWKPGAGD